MEWPGKKTIGASIVILALVGAGAFYLRSSPTPETKLSPFVVPQAQAGQLPVLFDSPPFSFVDQNGQPATDGQLRGHIWVADFIFTHCAGSCPKVTAKFVELQKALDLPDVRFVSFSVDPDRDDPHTLKDYAAKNNTGEARWMLLRPPDRKAIVQVALRMAAMGYSSDVNDKILHTDFFILIDHDGRVRGLYDSKDARATAQLVTDVTSLARQRLLDASARHNGPD